MDKPNLNLGETSLWEKHMTSLQDSRIVGSHPRAPQPVPESLWPEFSLTLKPASLLPTEWTEACRHCKFLHQGHP